MTREPKTVASLLEPFCDCCQHGNHTSPCTCGGVHGCCHPQSHFRRNTPDRAFLAELGGVAEAAVILEVSRARVGQLAELDGFPRPVARLKCGPVYFVAELQEYQAHRRRSSGHLPGSGPTPDTVEL